MFKFKSDLQCCSLVAYKLVYFYVIVICAQNLEFSIIKIQRNSLLILSPARIKFSK